MKSSALNHLIDRLRFPATAATSQAAYDRLRLTDVENAKLTRPEFIQIQNALPGTNQTLPISEQSEALDHDVILTGGITDAEDRQGNFYVKRTDDAYTIVGDEANVRLSIDALLGKSVATAGLAGVQDLISPILLEERQTITLQVYDDPAVADTVTTVFKGLRVFSPTQADGQLTGAERDEVNTAIAKYSSPQPRFITVPVTFASNEASAQTPKLDEPVLVHGFRSTFTNALINFGLSSADSFSTDPFAIWALCAEQNNARMLYQPLKFPMFIPSKKRLYFELFDSIDGVTFATDGQLELFATTP
jgi:hypothetical protein